MQGVTLIIALILSVLVIALRPKYALVAYIVGLLWYPSYLAVSIGTIDILVGRFVVAVLLLRCLFDDKIRTKFKWCRLDTLVTLSMVVYVGAYLITQVESLSVTIEGRGGFVMDTWCAYLAARFIVTDRTKLISIVKCVSIAMVPLAILGVIESVTGWQPFAPLRRYSPWFAGGGFVSEGRFGFARAVRRWFCHVFAAHLLSALRKKRLAELCLYYFRYSAAWRVEQHVQWSMDDGNSGNFLPGNGKA